MGTLQDRVMRLVVKTNVGLHCILNRVVRSAMNTLHELVALLDQRMDWYVVQLWRRGRRSMYELVMWLIMEVMTMRRRHIDRSMLRCVMETSQVRFTLMYHRVLRFVVEALLCNSRVIMESEAKGQGLLQDWVQRFVM